VSNGTDNVRVAVGGTNGHVLTVDSAETAGVKWAAGGGGLTDITETLHTASPNNTVNMVQLSVVAPSTNAGLVLTPKGTGPLIGWGGGPDSSTPGGNVRGEYAIDLQGFPKNFATRVASGIYSLLIGGTRGTASGDSAAVVGGITGIASGINSAVIAGGQGTASASQAVTIGGVNTVASAESSCVLAGSSGIASGPQSAVIAGVQSTASGNSAVAHGRQATASLYSNYAHASGQFAAFGDAQYTRAIARRQTTSTTATELFLDGSSLRLTIPSNKGIAGKMMVQAKQASSANQCYYEVDFVAVNNAGTSSLAFSNVTAHHESNAGADFAVTVDDTLDAIIMTWTAPDSNTWRCVAVIEAVEVI
jgi:hypothetical protein